MGSKARKKYKHLENSFIILSNEGHYEDGENVLRDMKKIEARLKQFGYEL